MVGVATGSLHMGLHSAAVELQEDRDQELLIGQGLACSVVGDRALGCVAARISERVQGAMASARASPGAVTPPPRRPGRVTLKQRRNGRRGAPCSARLAGSGMRGATQAFSIWFASPSRSDDPTTTDEVLHTKSGIFCRKCFSMLISEIRISLSLNALTPAVRSVPVEYVTVLQV